MIMVKLAMFMVINHYSDGHRDSDQPDIQSQWSKTGIEQRQFV